MKRSMKRKLATLVTFFVLILLFCERVTGVHIHIIFGLLFVIALGCHTWNRKNRILKCPIRLKVVDILSTLSLFGVMVSGFLLKPFSGKPAVLLIHKLCAVVLTLGIIVHISQHRLKKRC